MPGIGSQRQRKKLASEKERRNKEMLDSASSLSEADSEPSDQVERLQIPRHKPAPILARRQRRMCCGRFLKWVLDKLQ